MSRNVRWVWALNHALLGALGLFLFHALIVKQFRGDALALAALLALVFVLVLVNREIAGGVAPPSRTALHRAWASIEGPELLLIAFFLALLLVFDAGYLRATADGRSYFVHVRSLVIDADLDFVNENELFRTEMPGIFPFGSAILWLPFYLAAHVWLNLLNLLAPGGGAPYNVGGFGNPYQMAVGLGTLTYGFAGLLIVYRIARDYFSAWTAAVATVFVTIGSFLVWYLAIESSYTHGNSLFSTAVFLLIWQRTRSYRTTSQWAWLGIAAGVMTMVRWQNAVFLVFPLTDGLAMGRRALSGADTRFGDVGRGAAAFGGAFLLGVAPQLAFWKVVNGGWFAIPHGQSGQQWWTDSLVADILFSSNHGLFSWHPVIFLAVLGIPLFLIRDIRFGGLLTLVFIAQIYINGAVATWWGGHAFGARRFAGCTLLFVLGLAALMTWARKRPMVATTLVLSVFALGNAFFMMDIKAGRLPTSQGVSLDQIMSGVYARLGNPFSLPASVMFGRRYGISPWQYDQLGLRMFNNLAIDVGSPADRRFLGRGWGAAESAGDNTFRWAVGDESIVVAPLKAETFVRPGEQLEQAGYLVRFRVQPYRFEGAPPQSVELWVNDAMAGRIRLADELRDYEVEVPRDLLGRNLNVFGFRYAYARAPADDGGNDSRPLAVRFERIEFIRRPN